MISALEKLCGPSKQLKAEPCDPMEFKGLVESANIRLRDAQGAKLALESRFDLAYNSAHALSFAALRWHGYRSSQRYVVFQLLPHTLGVGPDVWRILSKCHDIRNLAEYEGALTIDERIVTDLISACNAVSKKVAALSST